MSLPSQGMKLFKILYNRSGHRLEWTILRPTVLTAQDAVDAFRAEGIPDTVVISVWEERYDWE